MSPGITRRDLLRTTSAALAGGFLPRATAAAHEQAPARDDHDLYDVCIVGSGFAGTYLGLHLVERGIRTVMIEAGPRLSPTDNPDGHAALFPCASEGDQEFPIDETRTIAVGGTSRKWNGVITRLLPDDFRARETFGMDVDWPLSYDDLATYYCQAERVLDVRGGPPVPEAEPARCAYPVESSGYVSPASLFPSPQARFFPLAFALRADGRPLRLDEEPLARFTASPHGTLIASHPVTELTTDERGAVTVVRARDANDDGSGPVREIRARCVVIAAGVVETARLLLASTSRVFPQGIGNARGLVGAHFHAHPRYRTTIVSPRAGLMRPDGVHRTYSFGAEARRAGAGAFLADVHLMPARPLVDVTLELEPAAANRIRLDPRRRDRWNRPSAVLRADWTKRDRRTRERSLTIGRGLATALGVPEASPPALRWFHPAGVCRMARDARHGVVDADCRVFGTPNLYVAGASVFPTSGSTNPTLTIVALALRLGDHLSRLLAQP